MRRALGVYDPAADSTYVHRFERELSSADLRPISASRALERLDGAGLVVVGEFHPLGSAAESTAELIARWAQRGRRAIVGLEFVFARDQHALDAYLAGRIGEREFRRRIRYDEEWGYPWRPLRDLLRTAREARAVVRGLDIPPRGGVAELPLRDRVAAERLAALLGSSESDRAVILLFGEAHLAPSHLPREIGRRLDGARQMIRLLHDVEIERLSPGSWAVDDARALVVRQRVPGSARLAALARVYRAWAAAPAGSAGFDLTLPVHGLLDAQAQAVGIETRRRRLGPGLYLADRHPEVFASGERSRVRRRLAESGIGGRAAEEALERAAARGAAYVAEANTIVVGRAGVAPVAVETGRHLCRWLGPDADPRALRGGPSAGRLIEGLAHAFARLVDPRSAARARPLALSGAERRTEADPAAVGSAIAEGLRSRVLSRRRLLRWITGRALDESGARRQYSQMVEALVSGIWG